MTIGNLNRKWRLLTTKTNERALERTKTEHSFFVTPMKITITSGVRVDAVVASVRCLQYILCHHTSHPYQRYICLPKKMAEDPSNNRLRTNAELRERLLEKVQLNVTETGKLGQQLLKSSRSHEVTGCWKSICVHCSSKWKRDVLPMIIICKHALGNYDCESADICCYFTRIMLSIRIN